jgi:hypothetical protein
LQCLCRRITENIEEVERTAAGEYRAQQGELIVSAPLVIGRSDVVPILVELLRTYRWTPMFVRCAHASVSYPRMGMTPKCVQGAMTLQRWQFDPFLIRHGPDRHVEFDLIVVRCRLCSQHCE